jgi:hypothetical protein
LLAWEPPVRALVPTFDGDITRVNSPYSRLIRGMKAAIDESGLERAKIAQIMGEWLGQPITENALNAALSEARDSHVINVLRFQALGVATADARLANLLVNPMNLIAVPSRYAQVIELAQVREARERLTREERKLQRVIGGQS